MKQRLTGLWIQVDTTPGVTIRTVENIRQTSILLMRVREMETLCSPRRGLDSYYTL